MFCLESQNFLLPTLPVDDFPIMDAQNLEVSFEIDSNEFKSLIGNSKFCMGLDELDST